MNPGDSSGIPDSEWAPLEARIVAFEAAWKQGDRPRILDHLADDDRHRQALLIELVHTEFEYRLKLGEPARVEEYLQAYPSLARSRKTVLDLVKAELSFRERREPKLSRQAFIGRFPEFRAELEPSPLEPPTKSTLDRPPLELPGSRFLVGSDVDLPRRFGKFELRQKLGEGAHGVVYRAWDVVLRREVAVKIPRLEVVDSHPNVRAFLREARNAIDLRHPQIVAIHDAGPIEGTVCIVRAFVEGTTLTDQIRDARFTPEEAAALMTLVAEALDHAHARGIIHRDLKPSNILLDLQGQPHITDFGLAKRARGDTTLSKASRRGGMIGTPAYMSPEQARGTPTEVDARSDVFSIGVVLYELLTGSLPFQGRGRMLLAQIEELEPTPPRSLNEDVTPDLESICLKALAKDPEERYQTAQAMADDLRGFLAGRPIASSPESERPNSRARRRAGMSVRTLIPAFLSFLVGASLLGWWTRERRSRVDELSVQTFRVLLDLGGAGQRTDLDRRIWSEVERLLPLLEEARTDPGLAIRARRALAERSGLRGSDRLAGRHWFKVIELTRVDPGSAQSGESLAIALANLAAIHDRLGDPIEARSLLDRSLVAWQEILRDRRRAVKNEPTDRGARLNLAEAALKVAEIERRLGRSSDLDEVETIARGLVDDPVSVNPLGVARLSGVWLALADLQLEARLRIKALRSTGVAERLFGEVADRRASDLGVGRSLLLLARSNRDLGRDAEAREQFRHAIGRLASVVDDDPERRRNLGQALFESGRHLDRSGATTDAATTLDRALVIRRSLVIDHPEGPLDRLDLAETRWELARLTAVSPVRAAWLRTQSILDRIGVLALAPGLSANRQELRRLALIGFEAIQRPRISAEIRGRLIDAIGSRRSWP